MQSQPDDNEEQQDDSQPQPDKTTNHNFNINGPYERFFTKIFDELLKVLAVFARWILSLSVFVAPKRHKDIIEGAREELKEVDGYLSKLFWSVGILATAIRFRLTPYSDNKEEAEQEL